MAQSILYYPSINIEDGPWLRTAALYWDEVCSIVPHDCENMLSPELKYMMSANYYRPIAPESIKDASNLPYSKKFNKIIEKHFSHIYISDNRIGKNRHINDNTLCKLIHYNKFPESIFSEFVRKGYIRDCGCDWVEMPCQLADAYMNALAEYLATIDRQNVIISTENKEILNKLFQPTSEELNSCSLSVNLTDFLPIPSPDVSFEDLLYFKEKHKDDFYEMRIKITNFENELSHCENVLEVKSKIERFKEDWEHEIYMANSHFNGDRIKKVFTNILSLVSTMVNFYGFSELINLPEKAIPWFVVGGIAIDVGRQHFSSQQNERGGFAYAIAADKENLLDL